MDISVVIPCYNESDNIPKIEGELLPVLQDLAAARSIELILIDDGSTDGTLPALRRLQEGHPADQLTIKVEVHPRNQGLGSALRTGFAASSGDVIITTDSDGTYPYAALPALLACLSGQASIVTASPYHPLGGVAGVPAYRLLLSRGSSLIYRILVDWRVHTFTSLFRAYRREVIEQVPFDSDGFLAGTELLVKAMLKGYRVVEFPAVLYRRVYGASKAKIIRTILAHLKFQAQVLLYQMHLFPIFKQGEKKKGQGWQLN